METEVTEVTEVVRLFDRAMMSRSEKCVAAFGIFCAGFIFGALLLAHDRAPARPVPVHPRPSAMEEMRSARFLPAPTWNDEQER